MRNMFSSRDANRWLCCSAAARQAEENIYHAPRAKNVSNQTLFQPPALARK
jgi:hypothetical protein